MPVEKGVDMEGGVAPHEENLEENRNDDVIINGSHKQTDEVLKAASDELTNNKKTDGSASFLRAARAGNLDKVLEFLKSETDINTCNANGLNALHLSSKEGHTHVVAALLERNASVDSSTKKGNTALHIASLAGQEDIVKILVEAGASVNIQSQNGFTPLYMAAQENHDSVVRYLLSHGANQSLATEDGFTPLAVALQQGHDKVVAVLLENDTRGKVRLPALHIAAKKDDTKAAALLLHTDHNPDVTSKSGFTPLHIASHYANENIAALLIQRGADVNYLAKHQITPLHVASKWGKGNMVSLLVEKGAKIEAKTRDGLTPLHCAARSGHETVVDMLLEKGAPITAKTKNGLAPLHMASQGDHVDAARILLYHKAPVDDVTVDFLTALHVAAHCGHVRVAKLLLDRKADANARALNGFTPLHIACKKNRIKVVELLLKNGASIESTTESGLTPLHVASFMGCMNIVIYLIQHGCSVDEPTVRGETPLHLAARANQADIIRILLRNGAKVDARAREQQTALHIASRLGNADIAVLLLQQGATVDAATKDRYTPLHIACKEGQEEVCNVLLDQGASMNQVTKKGFTPLHLASKYGQLKVAKLLLQREAPVDAQGKNNVTPLHVAAHYDHQNVALLLLEKGASPHATAKNGYTPLHIAARKNQMDIAGTLLEYGAEAQAESRAGFTPLHLAAQEGHNDMSSLLIENKADVGAHARNGLTPLHLAAQEDKVGVGAVLVKNGAAIDPETKAGYTPLHVACHFGQMNMVRFLLQHGAKVDAPTQLGYTPLHQAAQQGHTQIVNLLLEHKAQPNMETKDGKTALSIAQRLGYISVVETLKIVTETKVTTNTTTVTEEKYKVVVPESMHETFLSESEDEGGDDADYGKTSSHVTIPNYERQFNYTTIDDTMLGDQAYRFLTVDEMKSLGDDSMPIDDKMDVSFQSTNMSAPLHPTGDQSRQHANEGFLYPHTDNVDVCRAPVMAGFLVSFMVDARGGAMRGCRHSGVRVIIPPRKAAMPMRITCRYLKKDKLVHAPPLMEGEALASRILEMGPGSAKFLGPVIIEVPHFASLRGKEREIVILRSDNGETWREHTLEATEEAVQEVLNESFDGEDLKQLEDLNTCRITRILTTDFPQYFAIVTRIRQEVHAIGPEGGMVSSTVVPQVQAVFPQGALTKKIKVGLQAQPISADLVAKLLGNRVAVSPIVTVEPRRRKFHKPITLTIPVPQAASKGMINQYSGEAPTLRLLCSITGGTTRAQWEDVTGSTPLTFVNDCVSFTTTVSARFWLMDCTNIAEATKMATELYREAIHVPFMSKFVVFSKRHQIEEARLRVFCMTDDKEDKTLETQEQFIEVAKSRDVEVLEGKTQYLEFGGNLVPITKSGEQLAFNFYAFRENRLPFTVRVKDVNAEPVGRVAFMRQPKVGRGDAPQNPICNLNLTLPDNVQPELAPSEPDLLSLERKYAFLSISKADTIHKADLRLSDISNMLSNDWVPLAKELSINECDINTIKSQYPDNGSQQAIVMLRLWMQTAGNKATGNTLEKALRKVDREDIVNSCIFNVELVTDDQEKAVAKTQLEPNKGGQRDPSVETYEEKDLTKEAERADEEPQKSFKENDRDDMSPTYESEERKYAAEEKIISEMRTTHEESSSKKSSVEQTDSFSKKGSLTEETSSRSEQHQSKDNIRDQQEKFTSEEKTRDGKTDKTQTYDHQQEEKSKDELKESMLSKSAVDDGTTRTEDTAKHHASSITTTQSNVEESRVSHSQYPNEVTEVITAEKKPTPHADTTSSDKSELLEKLGQELGRLDEQLEEKFRDRQAQHDSPDTKEPVQEQEFIVSPKTPTSQITSQIVVDTPQNEKSEEPISDAEPVSLDSKSAVDVTIVEKPSQEHEENMTCDIADDSMHLSTEATHGSPNAQIQPEISNLQGSSSDGPFEENIPVVEPKTSQLIEEAMDYIVESPDAQKSDITPGSSRSSSRSSIGEIEIEESNDEQADSTSDIHESIPIVESPHQIESKYPEDTEESIQDMHFDQDPKSMESLHSEKSLLEGEPASETSADVEPQSLEQMQPQLSEDLEPQPVEHVQPIVEESVREYVDPENPDRVIIKKTKLIKSDDMTPEELERFISDHQLAMEPQFSEDLMPEGFEPLQTATVTTTVKKTVQTISGQSSDDEADVPHTTTTVTRGDIDQEHSAHTVVTTVTQDPTGTVTTTVTKTVTTLPGQQTDEVMDSTRISEDVTTDWTKPATMQPPGTDSSGQPLQSGLDEQDGHGSLAQADIAVLDSFVASQAADVEEMIFSQQESLRWKQQPTKLNQTIHSQVCDDAAKPSTYIYQLPAFSQPISPLTTDPSCQQSEREQNTPSPRPIKAEIKLLVKTTDCGKESIEIRSIREFEDHPRETPTPQPRMPSPVAQTIPKFCRSDRCEEIACEDDFNLLAQVRDVGVVFTVPSESGGGEQTSTLRQSAQTISHPDTITQHIPPIKHTRHQRTHSQSTNVCPPQPMQASVQQTMQPYSERRNFWESVSSQESSQSSFDKLSQPSGLTTAVALDLEKQQVAPTDLPSPEDISAKDVETKRKIFEDEIKRQSIDLEESQSWKRRSNDSQDSSSAAEVIQSSTPVDSNKRATPISHVAVGSGKTCETKVEEQRRVFGDTEELVVRETTTTKDGDQEERVIKETKTQETLMPDGSKVKTTSITTFTTQLDRNDSEGSHPDDHQSDSNVEKHIKAELFAEAISDKADELSPERKILSPPASKQVSFIALTAEQPGDSIKTTEIGLSEQEARKLATEIVEEVEREALKRSPLASPGRILDEPESSGSSKEAEFSQETSSKIEMYIQEQLGQEKLDHKQLQILHSVTAKKKEMLQKKLASEYQLSVEITDEDLRSSGAELSPIEHHTERLRQMTEDDENIHSGREPSEADESESSLIIHDANEDERFTSGYNQANQMFNKTLDALQTTNLKGDRVIQTISEEAEPVQPPRQMDQTTFKGSPTKERDDLSSQSPHESSSDERSPAGSSVEHPTKTDQVTPKICLEEVKYRKKTHIDEFARRSGGADLDGGASSSGESHYFTAAEGTDSRSVSRPCSSDVEGLLSAVTGTSEYDTAFTSQETSQYSQDFSTAPSSISSRDSMRSVDSETSGHLASLELSSEASETLVPSSMDLDKDLDMLDKDEFDATAEETASVPAPGFTGTNKTNVYPVDTESEGDADFEGIEDSQHASRMKRSAEMTFYPEPKILKDESVVDTVHGTMEESTISETSATTVLEVDATLERFDKETPMTLSNISDNTSSDILPLERSPHRSSDAMKCQDASQPADNDVLFLSNAGPVETVAEHYTCSQQQTGLADPSSNFSQEVGASDSHSVGPVYSDVESDDEYRRLIHRQSTEITDPVLLYAEEDDADGSSNNMPIVEPIERPRTPEPGYIPSLADHYIVDSPDPMKERDQRFSAIFSVAVEEPASPAPTQSSFVPDIKVTEHMAPVDQQYRYPDLECDDEFPECRAETSSLDSSVTSPKSTTTTDSDQGREYCLDSQSQGPVSASDHDSFEIISSEHLGDSCDYEKGIGHEQRLVDLVIAEEEEECSGEDDGTTDLSLPSTLRAVKLESRSSSGGQSLDAELEDIVEGPEFTSSLEEQKKWLELQFDDRSKMAGLEYQQSLVEHVYSGPLEDIEEERDDAERKDFSHLTKTSSLSSTPDYDVLGGKRFFTKSGDHDDVSMSSLQEFEKLEGETTLECLTRRSSCSSQDSLTGPRNGIGSKSGQGDDISVGSFSSLKEFEKLEEECEMVENIERKARQEEAMLSEIEEGHESQVSESESCETLSDAGKPDDDDYDDRLFEIDAIIRQAQHNVEELHENGASLRNITVDDRTPSVEPDDSLEERVTKEVHVQRRAARTLSQDSLDKNTAGYQMTTSADSLDLKYTTDPMTTSIDSLDEQKRKYTSDYKDSMITSIDSLDSGRDADISSGSERPVHMAGMEWSTDSLEPISSLATHGTYPFGTDSMLTGSYTSGSNTLVAGIDDSMTASMYLPEGELPPDPLPPQPGFTEGQPRVTETIEESDELGFSKVIRRTVTMPAEARQVSFRGPDAQKKMCEYIEEFSVGEQESEIESVDSAGNVHLQKVIEKRVVLDASSAQAGSLLHEQPQIEESCTTDAHGNVTRVVRRTVVSTHEVEIDLDTGEAILVSPSHSKLPTRTTPDIPRTTCHPTSSTGHHSPRLPPNLTSLDTNTFSDSDVDDATFNNVHEPTHSPLVLNSSFESRGSSDSEVDSSS